MINKHLQIPECVKPGYKGGAAGRCYLPWYIDYTLFNSREHHIQFLVFISFDLHPSGLRCTSWWPSKVNINVLFTL